MRKGKKNERVCSTVSACRVAVTGNPGGNQNRSGQDAGKGKANEVAVRRFRRHAASRDSRIVDPQSSYRNNDVF